MNEEENYDDLDTRKEKTRVGSMFSNEEEKIKTRVGSMFGGLEQTPPTMSRVGSMFEKETRRPTHKTRVGFMFGGSPQTPTPTSNDGMPNISPYDIRYYPFYNPIETTPNIGYNRVENFPSSNELSLSEDDKERLYPKILELLDAEISFFKLDFVQERIFNEYTIVRLFVDAEIDDNNIKRQEAHEIVKVIFLALYKVNNRFDLNRELISIFPSKSLSEIINLVNRIEKELKYFTREDLFKNWIVEQEIEDHYDYIDSLFDNKIQEEKESEDKKEAKKDEFKEEDTEKEIEVPTSLVANDKSKAKEMIDLTKFKFLEEELEFLRENDIEFQDSDSKWSWLTRELAEKYFVSVLLPYCIVKSDLSYGELYQLGFQAFLSRLKYRKIKFSVIKNKYITLGNQDLIHFLIREFGEDKAEEKLINAKNRLSSTTYIIPQYVIDQNRLKLRIISDLGFLPIKCKKCDIGIDLLLALHLHHPTKSKEIEIREIYAKPREDYLLILEKFKEDKVQLFCSNHHREKHVFYPIEFKEIIYKEDLFSMSAREIDVYIDNFLSAYAKTQRYVEVVNKKYISKNKEVPSKIIVFWKFKIKQWIKKRFAFNELFNGKCVVCGNSNLVHLDLHHLGVKNLFESWNSIKKFDCDEIMRLIVDDECVCLCSNCHTLITYNYHLSIKEVLKGFYPLRAIEKISKELTLRYNNAIKKIYNFQYNLDKLDLKCPLKLDFPLGDIWKSDLMTVYYYLELKERKFFFRNEILYDLDLSPNFIEFSIGNLIDMNYIKRSSLKYFLTQEGSEKISDLIQEYNEAIKRIKKKIKKHLENKEKYEFLDYVYSREDKCFVKGKRDTRERIVFKYCLIIFDLISKKGKNEFTTKELIALFSNKNYSKYRYILCSILAPLGLIEEVDDSISYQRKNPFIPHKEEDSSKILINPNEVIYRLTKKALDIIENGLDAL